MKPYKKALYITFLMIIINACSIQNQSNQDNQTSQITPETVITNDIQQNN